MGIFTKVRDMGLGGQRVVLFLHHDDDGYLKNIFRPSSSSSFSFSSSSSSSSSSIKSTAQCTIAGCALIVLCTVLIFVFSSLAPSPSFYSHQTTLPRRWLVTVGTKKHRNFFDSNLSSSSSTFALQGMGTLFRRGNRAMSDLLVAHLNEDVQPYDLCRFLRDLRRAGVIAKADVVIIFPESSSSEFKSVIHQENELFNRLIARNSSSVSFASNPLPFNSTLFRRKPSGSVLPLWGDRQGGGRKGNTENDDICYGSVVGFDSAELDPEETLGGFMDKVPMQMRRWACYRLLLGRVRRNFRHVMLMGVADAVAVGDMFARVRNRSAGDGVWISDHVIMGGIGAVRLLSDAMLTAIVRYSIQHQRRTLQSDSHLLTRLVKNANWVLGRKVKVTAMTDVLFPSNSMISSTSSTRRLFN